MAAYMNAADLKWVADLLAWLDANTEVTSPGLESVNVTDADGATIGRIEIGDDGESYRFHTEMKEQNR